MKRNNIVFVCAMSCFLISMSCQAEVWPQSENAYVPSNHTQPTPYPYAQRAYNTRGYVQHYRPAYQKGNQAGAPYSPYSSYPAQTGWGQWPNQGYSPRYTESQPRYSWPYFHGYAPVPGGYIPFGYVQNQGAQYRPGNDFWPNFGNVNRLSMPTMFPGNWMPNMSNMSPSNWMPNMPNMSPGNWMPNNMNFPSPTFNFPTMPMPFNW